MHDDSILKILQRPQTSLVQSSWNEFETRAPSSTREESAQTTQISSPKRTIYIHNLCALCQFVQYTFYVCELEKFLANIILCQEEEEKYHM